MSDGTKIEWAANAKPQADEDFGAGARLIEGQWMRRDGKARAGRLLDGREHNARPPLACETQRNAA